MLILALAVGVAGLSAVEASSAAGPTVVRAGNLIVKLNGGVTPKRLPKKRMAPITLRISANIATADGTHPPAARMVRADFDRSGAVDARGLATCRQGEIEVRTTAAAKAACRASIVGSGRTTVRVEFPESAPFYANGPLVLFNGGVRGGVTTMYIHAYVNVPAPTALVTKVKIRRVGKGHFGTSSLARIPVIAGGAGSVTKFNLKIRRSFRRKGKKRSYLTARCASGRLFANGTIAFANGSRISGRVVRPCGTRG
jgi:hypothetical protein